MAHVVHEATSDHICISESLSIFIYISSFSHWEHFLEYVTYVYVSLVTEKTELYF